MFYIIYRFTRFYMYFNVYLTTYSLIFQMFWKILIKKVYKYFGHSGHFYFNLLITMIWGILVTEFFCKCEEDVYI